jgi:hypothetical protein
VGDPGPARENGRVTTAGVVWLLDVDGVLNTRRPGWGGPPRRAFAYSEGRPFLMRWAPRLMERIRTIHTTGRVVIRWCTTWCPESEQLEKLFDLPRFERVWTQQLNGLAAGLAKLDAAYDVLAQGHRLVWTDDQEVPESGVIFDELTVDGRALLIAPDPNRGLQPEHLDRIERFIGIANHS